MQDFQKKIHERSKRHVDTLYKIHEAAKSEALHKAKEGSTKSRMIKHTKNLEHTRSKKTYERE